jgi:hypothetical protein
MWMTLNSVGRSRRLVLLFSFALLSGFLLLACRPQGGLYPVPRAPEEPQDAPRPAELPAEEKPPHIDNLQLRRPVELRSVTVGKLDSAMARLAGREFLRKATNPLAIVVEARIPFDPTPRTSWPVIVLNDEKLKNSRSLPGESDKLVAFLPDRSLIRDVNTVKVVWVGNEKLTMTKKPLTFTARDIRD